jgi:hypothetical protein
LNQTLLVLDKFILNIFTILSRLFIKLIVFFLDSVYNLLEAFHIVHKDDNVIFSLWLKITYLLLSEHIQLVDSNALKIFWVNPSTVLLNLKFYFLNLVPSLLLAHHVHIHLLLLLVTKNIVSSLLLASKNVSLLLISHYVCALLLITEYVCALLLLRLLVIEQVGAALLGLLCSKDAGVLLLLSTTKNSRFLLILLLILAKDASSLV